MMTLASRQYALVVLAVSLAAGAAIGITASVSAAPCPCTVFASDPTPTDYINGGPLEVGMKFTTDTDGYIASLRFYKSASMGGVHTGTLWNANGQVLSTVTYNNETASGWQTADLASPVQVLTGQIYTVSMYTANGRYVGSPGFFSSAPTVNAPLTAPANNTAAAADAFDNRGQGVFNASGSSAYPTSSFGAANYWVDVVYKSSLDTNPPAVTASIPADAATNATPGTVITATFDRALASNTVSSSTVSLRDAQGNAISGTVSYNGPAKTISFAPVAPLSLGASYTATLEGGSGAVITSQDGVALASDYSWDFSVVNTDPCPCSLKNRSNPANGISADDNGSIEVGTKLLVSENGYISGVRFYKAIIDPQSSHTVNIWNSSGSKLATATTNNESEYGWQFAKLSTPLSVSKGQLIIVSYGSPDAVYTTTLNHLISDIVSGPLTAKAPGSAANAATGSGNNNGVFSFTNNTYPSSGSSTGSYYWVDAVFTYQSNPAAQLAVAGMQPVDNSYGIKADTVVTASFDRALNGATVSGSTVQLVDASNNNVAGTAAYSASKHQIRFTPSNNLANGQRYTMKLAASVADTDGVSLGAERTWSFTVGSQLSANPELGPSGPVLVVTTTASKTSSYYAEILRAEGMNHFETMNLSAVTSQILTGYDAVVLPETSLTAGQVTMFEQWVQSGGNLVAMRPDKQLAALLGLTDAGTTRTGQYLLANTTDEPGQGIVNESIQFKGTADNYTVSGATVAATLYSNAGTATSNPAVTYRQVGSQGGTAAAFTYDLAKSVIALHQGNQAVAGIDSDGSGQRRSNDLFYNTGTSGSVPTWLDTNKLHIPQADEQQRLFANLLTLATRDRKPLPRFWYLPGDTKAAMVMSGDDHGLSNASGTQSIMTRLLNESTTNCSVLDWQCARTSHYLYVDSALTAMRAQQFQTLGFELGDHISDGGSCGDFASYNDLSDYYQASLTNWRSKYTGIPYQRTGRDHCYIWSDWDSVTRVSGDNNIRYNLNYVAFPNTWVNSRAPMVTGSGMNMRLTLADGSMSDIYQGVTNLDNTSATVTSINSLLDNATGSAGYYGMFGTHYDMSDSYFLTLLTSLKARPTVPLITAEQALDWLDGRNSSKFGGLSGSNGQYSFTIAAAEGANRLRAMMPAENAGGTITSISLAGQSVSYQSQAVKGVQYAVFDARPGSYTVTYSDYSPPTPPPTPSPTPPSPSPSPSTPVTPAPSAQSAPSTATPSKPTPSASNIPTETTTATPTPQPGLDPVDVAPSTGGEAESTPPQTGTGDNDRSDGLSPVALIGGSVLGLALLALVILLVVRRRSRTKTFDQSNGGF